MLRGSPEPKSPAFHLKMDSTFFPARHRAADKAVPAENGDIVRLLRFAIRQQFVINFSAAKQTRFAFFICRSSGKIR